MSYAVRLDFPPSMTGIYRIDNTRTGRKYIGSAVNIRNRWAYHMYRLAKGTHPNPSMQNAWNKYGEGIFACRVIEETDVKSLLKREQAWLDKTNAASSRRYYNVLAVAGSHLGRKRSLATIARMRKSQKGRTFTDETKAKMRAAKLGRPLSAEHRKKLSDAHRGRKLGPRPEEFKWRCRKLTPPQVAEFRHRREAGETLMSLAARFGIGLSTAQRIGAGVSYA